MHIPPIGEGAPACLRAAIARVRDHALRVDFESFIAKTFETVDPGTVYLSNWHIGLIAEYLEACRQREITRLLINMPPRALKSICASVAWPAYILGHQPSERIIVASYAQGLSLKHSMDCRLVMQSEWYRRIFAGAALSSEQNEKHKFMTQDKGWRYATSVGGTLTGEGGNFLIVDDPINAAHAYSETMRDTVHHWFDQSFCTRLNDKKSGVIVVVMQRLHIDDLAGHLIEKGGWEHLALPAMAMRTTVWQRGNTHRTMKEGDLLHAEREDVATLGRIRQELGAAAFAAQYQQQPLSEEGGMVRAGWLKRYAALPENVIRIVQSWDTAHKAARHNDASACATFVETEQGYYLADMKAVRMEYPELKRTVREMAEQWQPDVILVEDKASGQSLLQDLGREVALPLIAIRPVGDKVTRLAAVSALIESGKVFMPKFAPWLAEFESELLAFPGGAHDDQVDAFSQYLNWKRGRDSHGPTLRRI